MKLLTTLLWLTTTLLLISAPAAAQVREKIPEPTFERAHEEDDKGLQQWSEWEAPCPACSGRKVETCRTCDGRELPNCTECEGTKKAACRPCAGAGQLPDPLVEMLCTFCNASGWYACAQCAGGGWINVTQSNGDSERRNCGSCKKIGFFPCSVCKGKRLLPSVRVKRKAPALAKLKDLNSTRELLAQCLTGMQAFQPHERYSKSVKAFEALVKKPAKACVPLKDMVGLYELVQKNLSRVGTGFAGYPGSVAHHTLVFQDRSVYYLQYQLRVLDLCIKRAEFNEAALSKGK